MKLTKHGNYLYRLAHYGLINCYLIVEDDGLSIIDTGVAGTAKLLVEAAIQLQRPVRRILLTHAHGDHVGGLDALYARYPEAEVAISARDARFLAGDRSLDAGEPPAKLRGGFVETQTRPTRLLSDGDRIGPFQAVASPGHTPGQMAFFDTRDGTLFAGDAFQTQGGLAVAGQMRWRFPLPALATWHAPTALSSARKLVALEPNRLAVGHGPVLENPVEALCRTIGAFEKRLGQVGHADARV